MHHFGIRVHGKNFPIVCCDVHPNQLLRGLDRAKEILDFEFSDLYLANHPLAINLTKLGKLNERYNEIDPVVDLQSEYTNQVGSMHYVLDFEYWVDLLRHYLCVGLGFTIEFYPVGLCLKPSLDV